jgi:hypothetical protein
MPTVTVGFKGLAFFLILSLATCLALEAMGYRALTGHAVACTVGLIMVARAYDKLRSKLSSKEETPATVKVDTTWSSN